MLSIRFVHFYHFQEILTTEAVVVLSPHRDGAHRQSEHEPSLQPKGMRLASDIDDQLFGGDTRMKSLVSRPCSDDRYEHSLRCRRLLPSSVNPMVCEG